MKVEIITVGDEILIGQIIDSNSAWIAQKINFIDGQIERITSVSDQHDEIIKAISRAFETVDVILMTGGLGPTKDDITKKAIGDYYHQDFFFDESTYNRIIRFFDTLGMPTTEAHRNQCYFPKNVTLLKNGSGTAPGMWFEENGKVLISMPGVPYEMKDIMTGEVLPRLKEKFAGSPIVHCTIQTAGIGESSLSARLEDFEANLPDNVKLAYLPHLSRVRLRLTVKGEDKKAIRQLLDEKVAYLKKELSDVIFGFGDDNLETVIGKVLLEKGKTIASAESCTGGLIAHRLTSVSGSSAYFKGSVVAYANEIKMNVLGVKSKTLEQYGAVSEQTVIEMVRGVLKVMNTDIGIAVSGIAGPTGGTPDKPVGTIWIAVGDKHKIVTKKLGLGIKRAKNIEFSAMYAINMARKFLLES